MEKFTFTTSDNVIIAGVKNSPLHTTSGLLCLHMMPAVKESYEPLLAAAETHDILAWAIDFRGHGESTNKRLLDYHDFSPAEHEKYFIDAKEALQQLMKTQAHVNVIGASIGANYAAILQHKFGLTRSVLLSPGVDYYGVKPGESLASLAEVQATNIISSEHDKRVSHAAMMAQELFVSVPHSNKHLKIYSGDDHGTDIVMSYPDRLGQIISFLSR